MSIVCSMHDVMFGQAPCWSCCVLPTCALGGRIRWGSFCWFISSYPYFLLLLSVCVQISLSILGRGAGLAAATVARQNLWQLQEIFSQLPRKLYLTLQIHKNQMIQQNSHAQWILETHEMTWMNKYDVNLFFCPFGPLTVRVLNAKRNINPSLALDWDRYQK